MNLNEVKLNVNCIIKSINIEDEKTKTRLMELGIVEGGSIIVKNKSSLKKTLLIIINSCCFTLKFNLAQDVKVNYA